MPAEGIPKLYFLCTDFHSIGVPKPSQICGCESDTHHIMHISFHTVLTVCYIPSLALLCLVHSSFLSYDFCEV